MMGAIHTTLPAQTIDAQTDEILDPIFPPRRSENHRRVPDAGWFPEED